MTKSIFIDFDGTLALDRRVPPAHMEAVRGARRAGHRVFLCTGRPRSLVSPHLRHGVFDGLVCAAGGYVEIDGQVLADLRFPPDLAARTASLLVGHDATFILEAPDRILTSPASGARLGDFFGRVLGDDTQERPVFEMREDLSDASFSKATVMDSPLAATELAALLGPRVGALPNSITGVNGHAGELYLLGVDKSLGIATVEKHLGLDRADIIAIGDGMNDLEMIAYAGTGIAVEGAPEKVLAVAQRVIDGPASNGVARCFEELGLI